VGDDGEHQAVIHTEHGKGFRFVAEVTDLLAAEMDLSPQVPSLPAPTRSGSGSAGAAPISLVAELKRRNVFRVGAAYGIAAWLVVEVASVVTQTFEAPGWVMKVLTFLAILGFPLVVTLAWAFELTPEGIRFEKNVDRAKPTARQTGRRVDLAIIGLLLVALVFVVVIRDLGGKPPPPPPTELVPAEPPSPLEKSIAVLPCVNMSADAGQKYFADGIAEELRIKLAQIEGLRVVARTFSPTLVDRGIEAIAEVLNVDVILECSVRTAGNRVRITAQLNDAKDGFHRWSEIYDRELTDIFAIQTEIATAIADELRVKLSFEERNLLESRPTENPEASRAYLLGKHRLADKTLQAAVAAIGYFEQAIDLDPKFALAYVGLADCFMLQAVVSGLPTQEMVEKAHAAVNQALELGDRSGEADAALGSVLSLKNDFAGAEVAFRRALELNPNSLRVYRSYGEMLLGFAMARYDEALVFSQKAVELDPLSIDANLNVGYCLRQLGRFDEALASYERALEIDPNHAETFFQIAAYHWHITGRLDEAVVWLRKSLAVDPNPADLAILGWLYLELGDFDEADRWISRAYELGPDNYLTNSAMQALALYRGDDAAALALGEKAYEIWPRMLLAMFFLRDRDVSMGRYAEARARYEEHYPELLNDDPSVDRHNYEQAVDLALILARTGDPERAELLLERSLQFIQSRPHSDGYRGYEIADVQIHALRGEKRKALSALRQAIDEHWRVGWQRWLKYKPDLEPLHDDPEYQVMVKEIEADMAAQLAHVREMERNGELAPIWRRFPSYQRKLSEKFAGTFRSESRFAGLKSTGGPYPPMRNQESLRRAPPTFR